MAPTLGELAEDTLFYLPPQAGLEGLDRPGYWYCDATWGASVHRVRLAGSGVEQAIDEVREETRRRGRRDVTWWIGESATPRDLGERLVERGLVPDPDAPVLRGLVGLTAPPPGPPDVAVTAVETLDDYLAALEVDWQVWRVPEDEQAARRRAERARWEAMRQARVVRHYSAFLDGRRVGFGRAVLMAGAVALFGGSTLPDARGRGVYRSLVRARWEDAAARGTPTLVVQAGLISAPVLERLGFQRLGELRLFVDRVDARS